MFTDVGRPTYCLPEWNNQCASKNESIASRFGLLECHKPREAAFWTNSLRCHSAFSISSHGESDGTRVLMNSRRTYIFGIGRPLETVRRCCWSLSSKGYASELKRSSLEFGEFGDLRFFTGVKAKWRRCHSPLPAWVFYEGKRMAWYVAIRSDFWMLKQWFCQTVIFSMQQETQRF